MHWHSVSFMAHPVALRPFKKQRIYATLVSHYWTRMPRGAERPTEQSGRAVTSKFCDNATNGRSVVSRSVNFILICDFEPNAMSVWLCRRNTALPGAGCGQFAVLSADSRSEISFVSGRGMCSTVVDSCTILRRLRFLISKSPAESW